MRISDWSSDVCSSDLRSPFLRQAEILARLAPTCRADNAKSWSISADVCVLDNSHAEQRCWLGEGRLPSGRSEEHTSEIQSLMRISYAVFCLKKKKQDIT